MTDFFISYTGVDRAWAEWVAWTVEEVGYTTIVQAWDFRPGSNFVLEMDRAAREAARTMPILSPSYLESFFARPEWAAAFRGDPTGSERRLVPVRVERCDLKGLLASIVYIDLVGLPEDDARGALLSGLREGRGRPETAPSFPGPLRSVPERPPFPPVSPAGLPGSRPTYGRDEDVAIVVGNLLADPATPTVVLGAGGTGKTNLSLAALHHPDVASRFGQRRFFVRLEGAGSAAATAVELATAVGTDPFGPNLLARALAALAEAPAVVALDNAETPWEADTIPTEDLFASLAEIPGVALLASLRGIEGEGCKYRITALSSQDGHLPG